MKKYLGIMLTMSLMLFASAVFADHAPPNQTAAVSISCEDAPAIANIEAITLNAIDADFTAEGAGVISPVINYANEIAQPQIAVDSGRGYKRCFSDVNTKVINGTGWCSIKSGANRVRRLS